MDAESDVEARLRALEGGLSALGADLRDAVSGPAPRARSRGETHREVMNDLQSFGAFDWPDDDEPVDVKHVQRVVANLVRLAQVLAREIDTLRFAVEEALEEPGGRASPN